MRLGITMLLAGLLLSGCSAERILAAPPAVIDYEATRTREFRGIEVNSYNLGTTHEGIIVSGTAVSRYPRNVRPVCYLMYGNQIRLLEDFFVAGKQSDEFQFGGTARFDLPLNVQDSDDVLCRPRRALETAP